MALKSDYTRINNFLETEDLTQIEFSEHWGAGKNDSDKHKKISQHGGFDSDIDYLFTPEEKSHGKYKKTKQLGGINTDENNEDYNDYLRRKKQQGGNDENYSDYLRHKKQHGGNDSDYLRHKKQHGGNYTDQSDEDIDYLFTPTMKQSGGNNKDIDAEIERDFLAVFDEANKYRKNIEQLTGGGSNKKSVDVLISDSPSDDMKGGYATDDNFTDTYDDMYATAVGDNDQYGGNKAENTKRLKSVIDFAKKIKETHPELDKQGISWTGIVSIAWIIWKDAEKKPGNAKIEVTALELSDNINKYIQQYKALPPKVKKAKKPKKVKNAATPSRVYGGFY
jgi:hypothetical protein